MHRFVQIMLSVLRVIPTVMLIGALGFFGNIALQHALQHDLFPAVVVFVAATIAMPLAWLPSQRVSSSLSSSLSAICCMAVAYSLIQALAVHLYWETFVAFAICFTPTLVVIIARLVWWPLRTLSKEDRKTVSRALNRLPYDERQRIIWSGAYERLLNQTDRDM